jgi:hypothetical protein
MWFLHVATTYYVYLEVRGEHLYTVNQTALHEFDLNGHGLNGHFLSPGIFPNQTSYGSLQDTLEAAIGWKEINMKSLDKISATLPAIWFIGVLLTDDLQHWTKLIICNCFLAVLKGLFAFITIVPDSIGWGSCNNRLGPEGMQKIQSDIAHPSQGFFAVFFSTFVFEVKNVLGTFKGEKTTRFCADMLFSGHTYFTTLYALGLVELARQHVQHVRRPWVRMLVITVMYVVCITEQTVEIVLVLWNRFHYTLDVVLAIILTLLFFTNGSIAIVARNWYLFHRKDVDKAAYLKKMNATPMPKSVRDWVKENQLLWMPHWKDREFRIPIKGRSVEDKEEIEKWLDLNDVGVVQMPSAGETWTPLCCIPFCTLWGRYYLVSTDHYVSGVHHQPGWDDSSDSDYEFEEEEDSEAYHYAGYPYKVQNY